MEELNQSIFITPFDSAKLNSNSYNLSLSKFLTVYNNDVLDMKCDNDFSEILIPADGFVLQPNKLYLGSTVERTYTTKYIPMIEGRSSIARLGLFVHITAGLGEAGFDGHWTLEMMCVQPLRVYSNIPICQIYYNEISGNIDLCRSKKYQHSEKAITSQFFKEMEER